MDNTNNSSNLSGGSAIGDPFDPVQAGCGGVHHLRTLQLCPQVSVDYVFFSVSLINTIGSRFNDKFYMILNAPEPGGVIRSSISLTAATRVTTLTSAAMTVRLGEFHCYIAINTASPNAVGTMDVRTESGRIFPEQDQLCQFSRQTPKIRVLQRVGSEPPGPSKQVRPLI